MKSKQWYFEAIVNFQNYQSKAIFSKQGGQIKLLVPLFKGEQLVLTIARPKPKILRWLGRFVSIPALDKIERSSYLWGKDQDMLEVKWLDKNHIECFPNGFANLEKWTLKRQ